MVRDYENVIGLEIHLELKTKSKLFCSCPNQETDSPNLNVCPICLGHPGVLPALNKEAVVRALKLGLALDGKISNDCHFDRKNYFYPDLPKGYQISQYQRPLIKGGIVKTNLGAVRLQRIHLEEDTAKLFHWENESLLDFNRAGIPLLEIVTEPEIKSPIQAKIFLEELQKIIRYLEISDADMEKGQLRCDANISLRPKGDKRLYPKTEIKNLNSFKAVEKTLAFEVIRQRELWDRDEPPRYQATRGWDGEETIEQRGKEEEQDYRYFPEPDLPPLNKSTFKEQGIDLEILKKGLSELPIDKRKRFIREYGFSLSGAELLTENKKMADYTDKVVSGFKNWLLSLETIEGSEKEAWRGNKKQFSKLLSKWLINNLIVWQKRARGEEFCVSPENFADFLIAVYEKKITRVIAREVLEKMFNTGKDVGRVLGEYDFKAAGSKVELGDVIRKVVEDNPEIVEKYKGGKQVVIQYLIGQAMKRTRGKAEPNAIKRLLEEKLKN